MLNQLDSVKTPNLISVLALYPYDEELDGNPPTAVTNPQKNQANKTAKITYIIKDCVSHFKPKSSKNLLVYAGKPHSTRIAPKVSEFTYDALRNQTACSTHRNTKSCFAYYMEHSHCTRISNEKYESIQYIDRLNEHVE